MSPRCKRCDGTGFIRFTDSRGPGTWPCLRCNGSGDAVSPEKEPTDGN